MTASLEQHTVLPPDESAHAVLQKLAGALNTERAQQAKLVSADGDELEMPDEIYEVLREVVAAMSSGLAVTIAPLHAMLTTQQAADLLNISRPTLVKLLESGRIPFEQRSSHRRLRLADVLEYERGSRQVQQTALDEMTRAAVEDGSADDDIGFMRTR
ncbi:excisionase family DNA-binding protein [Saccharopolyspora gloriosae]|uniref:Excisionase family DNA binding protein n=1 Tax=Saccharopolyspora gloriosae TaxID=455344 RepID=A0A840NHE5_9PSEU|nr:helix-turn-helix domain-containing protein [Saccharopolyspora gloriosae]MBB5071310.1 excisionase family DNA binding protein [Saccharopolyspora gloriosae]